MRAARVLCGLGLVLGLGSAVAAPIPPEAAKKIGPALEHTYYNPAVLKPAATFVDTASLPLGVRIESVQSSSLPIRAEVLPAGDSPSGIGYLRLRSLLPPKAKDARDGKEWSLLEAELALWAKSSGGLVLDLRRCGASSGTPGEFAAAARIASWFVPPGRVLFLLHANQPDTPQQVFQSQIIKNAPDGGVLFSRPLLVLVNPETGGAGAALAAVLRREAGAIVLGRTADDTAALYQTVPLDADTVLRVPTASVQLPDGSDLLGNPVTPDVALYIDPRAEREILAQTALGPAAKGLVEVPPRHHMNEASLVHEENPEIADLLASSAKGTAEEALPLQDTALLRALDMLKGLTLFPVAGQ